MNKKIYLASPHMMGNEQKYVKEAFDTNWLSPLGPFVNRLEQDMCNKLDIKYACATSSGTAAIHLALKLAGVKEGDIVFCSTLTFSASANPIMYEKCIPVFIDSEEGSYNMSPKALEKAFKKYPNPKAVIIVSLYGNPAKFDELCDICEKHNTIIIEDAAEALGAKYKDKYVGTFGKYNIISFNGNKIITTTGGGMLLTNNLEDRNKALFWATQSRENERHYEHKEVGYNYRLSNVSAAIGCGQLEKLEDKILLKKNIYDKYKEGFKDIKEIHMANVMEDTKPNYWLSCLYLGDNSLVTPTMIMDALGNENIESRPIWKPMHMQPVFSNYDFFNHNDKGISVAEYLFNHGVCMPSDDNMTSSDIDKIIKIVRNLFDK